MRLQDTICREVFRLAEPEMGRHFTLNDLLDPLRKLTSTDAEAAQETRKLKEAVAADTEQKTLDRVKDAIAQSLASARLPHPASGMVNVPDVCCPIKRPNDVTHAVDGSPSTAA